MDGVGSSVQEPDAVREPDPVREPEQPPRPEPLPASMFQVHYRSLEESFDESPGSFGADPNDD